MNPTLPQDDPNPAERTGVLERARLAYRYNYDHMNPLALADEVPRGDRPSQRWLAMVAEAVLTLLVNTAKVSRDDAKASRSFTHHEEIRDLIESGQAGSGRAILQLVTQHLLSGHVVGRAKDLSAFATLYQEIPAPAGLTAHLDDASFARLRVAGPNPVMIRGVERLDERFPVREEHYAAAIGGGDSLAAAAGEGRLYLADYAALEGAAPGDWPSGQKYVIAPLALFAVPKGRRSLAPVAIQLGQRPGSDTPIFTPRDDPSWRVAKAIVNMADGNVHEAVSHLAHTHLVLEPIVMATRRRLAPWHPLRVLLDPHLEGTLNINDGAQAMLIAPRGGVDALMAGTIEASRALAIQGTQSWRFDAASLPDALAARGVDDAERLPDYPYRDDALLLWSAIGTWVRTYLAVYYPSDAQVAADAELQAWIGEITSPDGGRMSGIGQEGRIRTRDYLAETVTRIVFTASAQHAAVNFPQYPIMSYAPNMPLAVYAPALRSTDHLDEAGYLAYLPPLDMALMQLGIGYLLGSIHYTRLGRYPRHAFRAEPDNARWEHRAEGLIERVLDHFVGTYFEDGRVLAPLRDFQGRLAAAERTIDERNRSREPYDYLKPSLIPQSINI